MTGVDVGDDEVPTEDDFLRAMLDDIVWCERNINYRPTRWRQMIAEHGAVEAAKILLAGPDASDGFTTLWEKQALDRSVEWCVLRFPTLFTDDELEIARQRLRSYGVPVEDWLEKFRRDPDGGAHPLTGR